MTKKKPKYNTWIRIKKMGLFIGAFLCFVTAAILIDNRLIRILMLLGSLPFGYISLILILSYRAFSEKGGNAQNRVHNLIVDKIETKSGAMMLDIGAGSGSLSIKAAQKNGSFRIKAVDYWGSDWEYSKQQCLANAELEGVSGQVAFIKGSASQLPFDSGTFDGVISCLTFHEVKDTEDKSQVILEAMRVLKSGGQFVFFDLFYKEKVFGDFDALLATIKKGGSEITETANLAMLLGRCPKILFHKKVLGYGALITGKKR